MTPTSLVCEGSLIIYKRAPDVLSKAVKVTAPGKRGDWGDERFTYLLLLAGPVYFISLRGPEVKLNI